MSKIFRDLTNEKYGRLKVVSLHEKKLVKYSSYKRFYWLCQCRCGNTKVVRADALTRGRTKSCGCLHKEIVTNIGKTIGVTHGMSSQRFYKKYRSMENRCNLEHNISYKNYAGRGIECEWKTFESFKLEMYESYLEHVKKFGANNTTIDRIDGDGNYSKSNCRWATYKEQNRNYKRNVFLTFKGETRCATDWAEERGLKPATLLARLKRGWNVELAITAPKGYWST